jgi:hypothetical protein
LAAAYDEMFENSSRASFEYKPSKKIEQQENGTKKDLSMIKEQNEISIEFIDDPIQPSFRAIQNPTLIKDLP